MLLLDGIICKPVAKLAEYVPVNENPLGGPNVKLDPASSARFTVWDHSSVQTPASSPHSEKYKNDLHRWGLCNCIVDYPSLGIRLR